MKSKLCCPNPNHTPAVEEKNSQHNKVKHGFGAEPEAFLNEPVAQYTSPLGCNTDNEEICQSQGVIRDNAVLKGGDDGDGRIQSISQQKITYVESVIKR